MATDVEVQINYSEKEVKKAISFWLLKIYKVKIMFFIVYPIIIIGIILSLIFSQYAILSIAFIFFGLLFHYFYYIGPLESYKAFYRKRKGGTYIFNNAHILIIGDEIQSTILWSVFKKSYEIPFAFLLTDANKFIYIFPKNCFNDNDEIDKLRKLLIDNTAYSKYK